jgi:HK97 gp10 family phage protein
MMKGLSFKVDGGKLEEVVAHLRSKQDTADRLLLSKIRQATEIVYKVASARRPMMSRTQMKMEGRRFPVSDPNAQVGVPVAYKNGGALRSSIQRDAKITAKGAVGRVWTDMPYAKYIEYGTSKMAARPFMRPAINTTREAIKALCARPEKV